MTPTPALAGGGSVASAVTAAPAAAAPLSETLTERRKISLALVVACALFMEMVDSTALAPALPTIARQFGETPLQLSLALSSYMVTLAVLIPASGWAADRFGARRVFVSAIGVFVLGSVLCSMSWNMPTLVAARIVQGVGGAMMSPVGRLALLQVTRKDEILRMMSWVSIPAMIGPIVGPGLGGFLTEYVSWHWIFLVNVPIGLLGALFALRLIPDVPTAGRARLDVAGLVLAGLGCGGLVFGIDLVTTGVGGPAGYGLLAVAAVSLAAYIRRARTQTDPLLDFGLFRYRTFSVAIAGGFLFRSSIGAMPLLFPLLFQLGFGLDAFKSGMLTVCSALGIMGMKAFAPFLIRTFGYRRLVIGNALINVALFLFQVAFPILPWSAILVVLLAGGLFRSLHFTALNTLSFAEVPSSRLSRATAISSVGMQMSNSVGIGLGTGLVALFAWMNGATSIGVDEVAPTFYVLAGLTLIHAALCFALPANAGADLMKRGRA